jgi:hypothetical protein
VLHGVHHLGTTVRCFGNRLHCVRRRQRDDEARATAAWSLFHPGTPAVLRDHVVNDRKSDAAAGGCADGAAALIGSPDALTVGRKNARPFVDYLDP